MESECWRTFRRKAVVTACGGALAAVAQGGLADEFSEPRGSIRVDVTGSNIRRIESESGLPLQIIERQELVNGGVQTVQELLERISANQSFGGWTEAMGGGNARFGFTGASLRGLGTQRTLVLLNGRRVAPYAASTGQGVDLSAIPTSALDRVEILKDGASAIYGSDAIGGVINFILRKDFTGVELNANYFATQHGGGDNWRANATAGIGDLRKDRYNAFVSVDYFEQDPLQARERASTRTGYLPDLVVDQTSGLSFPANIRQPDGFGSARRNPTIPYPDGATPSSCSPPDSLAIPWYPYRCSFDPLSFAETIPETQKTTVIGRATWMPDAATELFLEGSYYRGVFTYRIAPTPVWSGYTLTPMTLPPSSPFYPADFVAGLPGGDPTLPVEVDYRTIELGPRVNQGTAEQWRGVAGLQGVLAGWDYALVANATSNHEFDDLVSGYVSEAAFGPLLRSGVLNPFGYNSPAVVDALRATQFTGRDRDWRASDYGGAVKLSRDVYKLPGGPLALALGLEGRREHLEVTNADFIVAGDVMGTGGAPSLPDAHRTVWAVYGELSIPVFKSFEATAALRYDHYSDFGRTTNPKVSLRWQPARELLLRASWDTGFRVPTLSDLYQPWFYFGFTDPYDDPLRCPVTGSPDDCQTQFLGRTGGNPLLQPEKSTQWGVGAVVELLPGLSLGADYFNVEIRNLIDFVLQAPLFADWAFWEPTQVVRNPATPEDIALGIPGAVDYVIENPNNFGTLRTSGIDVDIRYRSGATQIGQFTLSLAGTYVIDYDRTGPYSNTFPAGAGARSTFTNGAIARWRHYATLDWTYGPWGATLANTMQSGYAETCNEGDTSGCATRRVGSYSIWDLQGRYTGAKDWTMMLGIRNLMDTVPPVSNLYGESFHAGIDPVYADPRGRMFYGAIRYALK